jgi:hypothetical protein
MVKPGSKYYPLYHYLRQRREETLTLTFKEVEQILGDILPISARRGRAFWSNRSQGGLQASAWMQSGYTVAEVDLPLERVTFRRPIIRYTVKREGEDVLWDSEMIRALRQHLGVNQGGLASILGVRQQTVSEWENNIYVPTRARSKHITMVAEQAGFPFRSGEINVEDRTDDKLDNTFDTV